MRLLLDTQVFLWFISNDPRLPAGVRAAILDPGNEAFLSVLSVWEATIKYQTGKLPFPQPASVYLPTQRDLAGFVSLPLDERSVARLGSLPPLHRDPFDRMLVCQAIEYGMTLVTADDAVLA